MSQKLSRAVKQSLTIRFKAQWKKRGYSKDMKNMQGILSEQPSYNNKYATNFIAN